MSFAMTLSTVLESDGDYLDIEVNSIASCVDMMQALNNTMAEGVRVENVIVLPQGTPNAMSSVAAAGYRLIPKDGAKYPDSVIKAADKVLSADSIVIRKENKKAKKKGRAVEGVNDYIETDVKDRIFDSKITESEFYCLVDASSAGNVRPMSLLELIYNTAGVKLNPVDIQIIRTDLYTDNEGKLIPLDGCVGND